jgi:TolB-like protein
LVEAIAEFGKKKKEYSMQKKVVALGVLGALLVSSAVYAEDYWTGDGGRGVNLAVLAPEGRGLSEDQAYTLKMIQDVLIADLSKYSAMSVIDWASIEKALQASESGVYNEEYFVKLGEIHIDHVLTGSLTKTSSGLSLRIRITSLKDGKSKSSNWSLLNSLDYQIFNQFIMKTVSADLLESFMGISLTDQAREEMGVFRPDFSRGLHIKEY